MTLADTVTRDDGNLHGLTHASNLSSRRLLGAMPSRQGRPLDDDRFPPEQAAEPDAGRPVAVTVPFFADPSVPSAK